MPWRDGEGTREGADPMDMVNMSMVVCTCHISHWRGVLPGCIS